MSRQMQNTPVYFTIAQVRLLVPLWVAVQALGERRRHRPSE